MVLDGGEEAKMHGDELGLSALQLQPQGIYPKIQIWPSRPLPWKP
jgi:hypothetical protein